jgi:hypothetical protein
MRETRHEAAGTIAGRDVVWIVMAHPADEPDWRRTVGVSVPDLTVFAPAFYGGDEDEVMLLCCEDGFQPQLWGHHWHVPSRWLARQRPGLCKTLERIERLAQEQLRDD